VVGKILTVMDDYYLKMKSDMGLRE